MGILFLCDEIFDGCDPIQFSMSDLVGKNIAIIGGTGTLGRALVKELIDASTVVQSILIFSRDEIKQLEMMEDLPNEKYPFLDFKLGDVRDLDRLTEVLEGMDYVIHAAALKHVVMAENNPQECWKTNVLGTENVIRAAQNNKVKKTLLASTDKAYKPLGVYGKSKAEAERLFLEANTGHSAFTIVRLGNIIGARGSVFEAFKKQKKRGVIKVTHPEATRFCISQKDAAKFILDALQTESKEILTPEMKSFQIIELAKEIAPECTIEITGLRPGDKLHEEVEGTSSQHISRS